MPRVTGVPGLLSGAEHALFHGPPDRALGVLRLGRDAPGARTPPRARWLTGVALGALGRYGQALAELEPLLAAAAVGAPMATPEERLHAGYGAGTTASLLRQVGDHVGGRRWDSWGLHVLAGLDPGTGPRGTERADWSAAEAAADCAIGLAADAVGLGDAAEAQRLLGEAARRVGRCGPQRWRVRVRQGWLVAEVALLTGRPDEALAASRTSLLASERAGAPRHVVKSLLFPGVAQLEVDRRRHSAAAVDVLRRGATLAEGLGLLPLVWPARAVLGAALAAGAQGSAAAAREAQESLDIARVTVDAIAGDLPQQLRDAWLCRPDIRALFA